MIWELDDAAIVVERRSRGLCEAGSPWCQGLATQIHHIAGRGFPSCHHPELLLHVCGNGNIDGCHGWIHRHGRQAIALGWMMSRIGEALAAWRRQHEGHDDGRPTGQIESETVPDQVRRVDNEWGIPACGPDPF